LWSRLARRFGARSVLQVSCIVMAGGQVWLFFFLRARESYWTGLLLGGFIYNIGFGLTFARLHATALTGVPEAALGSATASFSTARQFANGLGAAITIAILGDAVVISERSFRTALAVMAACSVATVAVVWLLLGDPETPVDHEPNDSDLDLAL
jgi:MFS family permease